MFYLNSSFNDDGRDSFKYLQIIHSIFKTGLGDCNNPISQNIQPNWLILGN